jgi:hypothetical protein
LFAIIGGRSGRSGHPEKPLQALELVIAFFITLGAGLDICSR